MPKIGILVHCRHLATENWQELVFGTPSADILGDQATLARVLLTLGADDHVACVVFGRGPSFKDGLNEAEYAKKYLHDNFDRLQQFPTLQPLFANLDTSGVDTLKRTMESAIITDEILNTVAEIAAGAEIFNKHGVQKVIQICAATHASRCIKEQLVARQRGLIDPNQLWMTVATGASYQDASPSDVFVVEPLHRSDQPMTHFRPALYQAIAPYYSLSSDDQQAFNHLVDDFMQAHK